MKIFQEDKFAYSIRCGPVSIQHLIWKGLTEMNPPSLCQIFDRTFSNTMRLQMYRQHSFKTLSHSRLLYNISQLLPSPSRPRTPVSHKKRSITSTYRRCLKSRMKHMETVDTKWGALLCLNVWQLRHTKTRISIIWDRSNTCVVNDTMMSSIRILCRVVDRELIYFAFEHRNRDSYGEWLPPYKVRREKRCFLQWRTESSV